MSGPAIGTSTPVTPADERWEAAAAELTPAKSLARMDDRGKQVVTGIGLVGTLLTGVGLVASGQLDRSAWARGLAVAAVCVAVAAVVAALGTLLLRFPRRLAPGDVAAVKRFYLQQFDRGYWVVGAGVLLLVAVLLAGAAAVVVLAGVDRQAPAFAVRVTGTGEESTLTVRAEFPDVSSGRQVRTDVVGVTAGGVRVVLVADVVLVGASGAASVSVEVPKVGGYATVEVTVAAPTSRCTATLAPGSAGAPVVGCVDR